jgi:cysteine desulfurase/selenocysteine lyase
MKIENIRHDFPILQKTFSGYPLTYLDNAATTQKPQIVIDVLSQYYESMNANIHRGVYALSEQATKAYEEARHIVQRFINAPSARECIFLRSTTEAINLVATCFGELFINAGDEILISAMEHHSNIVPWQMLCQRKGAFLKVIPINTTGELDIDTLEQHFSAKTKLLGICHAANAIGTLNPIQTIIQKAHAHQIPVLVDAAQSATHCPIDVQALDCDFLTFSSHKIYGPTGVGVLYGKAKWLEIMPPYQGGGDMISSVSFDKTTYNDIPFKFEAGTPAIASTIAFGSALNYLSAIGWDWIEAHEKQLLDTATDALSSLPFIRPIGTAKNKIGILSFVMEGVHPHDVGSIADQYGVALRTGHHCAMPLMDFYQVPATVRASFGLYNTLEDIDRFIQALHTVHKIFGK